MAFSEEYKVFIKVLRQERGMERYNLSHSLQTKNWSLSSVKKLLTKIDQMVGYSGLQHDGLKQIRTSLS